MTDEQDHIGDFEFDQRNARKHNPRNIGMIEKSLNEVGVGRPIVATRDGTIIAGNGVLEAAALAGIEKVVTVHTTGNELIVHVRDDLEYGDRTATLLGLYDNRASELSEWDMDVVKDLQAEFEDEPRFEHIFTDREINDMMGVVTPRDGETEKPSSEPMLGEIEYRVVVECYNESDQADLMADLQSKGRVVRAVLS